MKFLGEQERWLSRDHCCFCCTKAKGQLITTQSFFFGKYFKTLFDIAELVNISLENDLNILVY